MRPHFEQDLRRYSELAKGEQKIESAKNNEENISEEFRDFSGALNWRLKRAAEGQGTPRETQTVIYQFQKDKQEIMGALKSELSCLDNPECKQREKTKDERYATYNAEDGTFNYMDDQGYKRQATFGEVVTDLEWDVDYCLDTASVPRDLVKKYLLERAKRDLGVKLDQQIIASESQRKHLDESKREAYRRVAAEQKTGEIKMRSGVISEKIVQNFMKKLSIDRGLPYTVRHADIYQDVEQKIDFIIHREDYARGVGVEAGKQDVGIQFSINKSARGHKARQVARARRRLGQREPIKDIVLVIFPKIVARKLMRNWTEAGRPAGGPDKALNKKTARELYTKLLAGVFTKKEIAQQWEKAQSSFNVNNK